MTGKNNLGFYGKIPIKGDFVSRHLPRSFVEPWDQWLQESIATSREQLSDHWLDSYLTSPIWRFALSKGVCDENTWIGLMIPSVDSVGRYFPLTLAAPVNNASTLISIVDQEEPWFSQAEQIALSALDQDKTFDAFNQDIDELDLPRHLHASASIQENELPKAGLKNSDNWRITMEESRSVSANLSSLTEQFLLKSFPNVSLWWSSGSEKIEPSILICNKLPPTQGFSALLSANWEHWGWDNKLSTQPHSANENNEVAKLVNNENTRDNVAPVTSGTETPS